MAKYALPGRAVARLSKLVRLKGAPLMLVLTLCIFSLASTALAAGGSDTFIMESTFHGVFYLHNTRPPLEPDGPTFISQQDFDRIFRGDDRSVGYLENDVDVLVDAKTGCFYKSNDNETIYHLDLLGGGTDSYYGFTPSITWNDGKMITETPFSYDPGTSYSGKCADVRTKKSMKNKLVAVGKITGTNLTVYEPKNPLKSSELKKLYKQSVFPEESTPTFKSFVLMHPLIYVDDRLGSYHRLLNSEFAPAAEMGKPALYLYPEKEGAYGVTVNPVGGKITAQIPVLNKNTWSVTAKPSGEITSGGVVYPYLYYESTTNQPMPLEKGVVLEQKQVPEALPKMLDEIGFKPAEAKEFLDYWLPRMKSQPYYAVQFLFNEELDKYSKLAISPQLPVYRVFLNFQGLSKKVELPAQKLLQLNRLAPHAFEWGGNNLAK